MVPLSGLVSNTVAVCASSPAPDRAPAAHKDGLFSKRRPGSVNVLANDTDADGDALAVTHWDAGHHGSVTCRRAGRCTYVPGKTYKGNDSFAYTISDGRGATASARVFVRDKKTVTHVVRVRTPPAVSLKGRPFTTPPHGLSKQATNRCDNVEIGAEADEAKPTTVRTRTAYGTVRLEHPFPRTLVAALGFTANVCFDARGVVVSEHDMEYAPAGAGEGLGPFIEMPHWAPISPPVLRRRITRGKVEFSVSGSGRIETLSPRELLCMTVTVYYVPQPPVCEAEHVDLAQDAANALEQIPEISISEDLVLRADGTVPPAGRYQSGKLSLVNRQ